MSPLLVFAQICRACDKRWLSITTQAKPDDRCWACWSTDVHIVGRPKRWEAPATDPPDPPPQSEA